MTHLTVVSVERLQLFDIIHVDALWQRLSAQVRRGKWRQSVGRICIKPKKSRQVSFITHAHKHRCIKAHDLYRKLIYCM